MGMPRQYELLYTNHMSKFGRPPGNHWRITTTMPWILDSQVSSIDWRGSVLIFFCAIYSWDWIVHFNDPTRWSKSWVLHNSQYEFCLTKKDYHHLLLLHSVTCCLLLHWIVILLLYKNNNNRLHFVKDSNVWCFVGCRNNADSHNRV